jgi:hypothetical protein
VGDDHACKLASSDPLVQGGDTPANLRNDNRSAAGLFKLPEAGQQRIDRYVKL